MRYDFITIIKLVAATFLPVVLSVALYLAEKKTRFGKVQYWKRQTIIGVLFGGVYRFIATYWGRASSAKLRAR